MKVEPIIIEKPGFVERMARRLHGPKARVTIETRQEARDIAENTGSYPYVLGELGLATYRMFKSPDTVYPASTVARAGDLESAVCDIQANLETPRVQRDTERSSRLTVLGGVLQAALRGFEEPTTTSES